MKLFQPNDGYPPQDRHGLVQSVRQRDLDNLRAALAAGADLDARDEDQTALLAAAQEGWLEAFELLLDAGADPYDGDVLQTIVSQGRTDLARAWIARGLNVNVGEVGDMPLMCAAFGGFIDIVRMLVAAGADVNAKDLDGQTALSIALQAGHRDIAALLRQAGGIVDPFDSYHADVVNEPEQDFSAAARRPAFQAALRRLADLFGEPLTAVPEAAGIYRLTIEHAEGLARLVEAQAEIRAMHFHLVRVSPPARGPPMTVWLLPTRNKFAVLAAVGTNGENYGLSTRMVIDWLRKLAAKHPFELLACAHDSMEGRFENPIRNAASLAKRIYRFCPDVVDQGCETIENLAEEIQRTQRLYLWWD